MRRLWDFINHFPRSVSRTTRRRIPCWVREDLEWWNRLLPTYNSVLFFGATNRATSQAYTDACLYGLGGFYFLGTGTWNSNKIDQDKAFRAVVEGKQLPSNRKLLKDPNDPSINFHEVEAILLLFQTWALVWHRHRIVIHTDSSTACPGLLDFTLKGPANAPLREIFLIAAKRDMVIEPRWIEGKLNGLADALSRFDDNRIANLCPHWQNPVNLMTLRHPIYHPHPVQRSSNDSNGTA